jgi:hypothetical protein
MASIPRRRNERCVGEPRFEGRTPQHKPFGGKRMIFDGIDTMLQTNSKKASCAKPLA